uniref:Ig-like domain-containing protein n=1 Tax=Anopheles dirus TaxID=7168 RepID=A0A182N593_9DIPT
MKLLPTVATVAEVTVPPDIINEESSADIAVQEGEDATIVCKAVGHPTPRVTWKREDGEYMLLRKPQSRELIRGRCKRRAQSLCPASSNPGPYRLWSGLNGATVLPWKPTLNHNNRRALDSCCLCNRNQH